MDLEGNISAYRKTIETYDNILSLRQKVFKAEKAYQEAILEVYSDLNTIERNNANESYNYRKTIREWLGILDVRYGNKYGHIHWVAKDSDGTWWGFDNEPVMRPDGWYAGDGKRASVNWEYRGDCPDRLGIKENDTIDWKDSVLEI